MAEYWQQVGAGTCRCGSRQRGRWAHACYMRLHMQMWHSKGALMACTEQLSCAAVHLWAQHRCAADRELCVQLQDMYVCRAA